MPIKYSIAAFALWGITIPLAVYLCNLAGIKGVAEVGIVFVAMLTVFFVILKYLNSKIAIAYDKISQVVKGNLNQSLLISKPKLNFTYDEIELELTYELGGQYYPSVTTIKAMIHSMPTLRVYREDGGIRALKKLNLDWPDVEIGDSELDRKYVFESMNHDFVKSIFTEETRGHLRKLSKILTRVQIDSGNLLIRVAGIYLSLENYKELIELAHSIIDSNFKYQEQLA